MKRVVCYFILVLFIGSVFSSCSKDEEMITVPDNVAPIDETIEEVTISNYVQKTYIALLGRKPTETEQNDGFDALKEANVSLESRQSFVSGILSASASSTIEAEYFESEFTRMRSEYLNGLDSADFAGDKAILEFAKTLTANPLEIALYDYEIARLDLLIGVEAQLKSKSVNVIECHKVLVNNFEYDQINMGTENFVVSLFQNFYHRYPTTYELTEGKNMVDGKSALLFTKEGKTKDNLIDIFFSHGEYFEGEVRTNFLRFLYREPTNDEIALLAASYQQNQDYQEVQKYILTLDEYVGLE